ncbi:MAG: spore cortex biosynthesis protein YabQ [Firmicutes bacterium]|nr:spore cortex biosynthesis protein YabQ [Bacillota bacterium]
MIDTVRLQLIELGVTALAGVIMGILFDLYRVARWALRPGKVITVICDIIFWLLATTVVFIFLVTYSWGDVRFYMFVGFAAGFCIYRAIFGRHVVGSAVSTYEHVQNVRKKVIIGYREGALGLRRVSTRWRKGFRKGSGTVEALLLNIKNRLFPFRKES